MDSKIKSFNLFFLLAFLTFILSSCSSSKNIANDPIYNPSGNEQLLSKDEMTLIKEAKSWIGTKYKYGRGCGFEGRRSSRVAPLFGCDHSQRLFCRKKSHGNGDRICHR